MIEEASNFVVTKELNKFFLVLYDVEVPKVKIGKVAIIKKDLVMAIPNS